MPSSAVCNSNAFRRLKKGELPRIQENKENEQAVNETDIHLDRKVMISPSPSSVKPFVFPGTPCCYPLLLSLLRWSRKLLASSGLF